MPKNEEMKLNTNSNTYTIVYASIVVVIVAFLLAFASKALQPYSDANERIDKKKQILAALNLRGVPGDKVEETYDRVVERDLIVNAQGEEVKAGTARDKDGFQVKQKDITPNCLPLYVCRVEGQTKYVVPLTGKGLWGAIWGYLSVNADGRTVYGAYFSHQSETAGLGARITEEDFQNEFKNKQIWTQSGDVALSVVKHGSVRNATSECDGISGATLTTDGVNDMLHSGLARYARYLSRQTQQQ